MVEHPPKIVRCGYCADYYDVGQIVVRDGWEWYPEGEQSYWKHCLTEHHQNVLAVMHHSTVGVLADFEQNWETYRTASKEARDPAVQAMRGLFR